MALQEDPSLYTNHVLLAPGIQAHPQFEQACASTQTGNCHSLSQAAVTSVPVYSRHVFLMYKRPGEWPSGKLGSVEAERLPRMLSAAIKAAGHRLGGGVQLTVCEDDEASDGDALIFPDMKRFKALTVHDLELLVEEVLVSSHERFLSSEPLSGVQLFVCCDPSRGGRCAHVGTPLLTALRAGVEHRGWTGQVTVRACSHAGCKGEAGRVLVFSRRGDCSVGHWYGGVSLADVAALLDDHIGAGRIVEHIWQGQMVPPQGHPRTQPAPSSDGPPLPQRPSFAPSRSLTGADTLLDGDGQLRAASPEGSEGEVDESVLGYSMAASDSSEEGLFSPGGGGGGGVGRQGALFGSGRFSLESVKDAALMELARSEGAGKGEVMTVRGPEKVPSALKVCVDTDVHNEGKGGGSRSGQTSVTPRKGISAETEPAEEEKRLVQSQSWPGVAFWRSAYLSTGVFFDARAQLAISVAAIGGIVAFQLARKHAF